MNKKQANLFHNKYKKAIFFSLAYQMVLLLFSAMILDGGQCGQYMLVSMAGFWVSVIVLIIRKPWSPSKKDIFYIKWGFFLILFFVPLIMKFTWMLRGIR
ncbi:MAG: hypothetical protein KOO69_06185 [Victivallales bacterium]|nr:hypothetical protein [Victivallales bacterium]